MVWIEASGTIQVDNGVRVATNIDLCKFYNSLIKKQLNINPQLPFYGAHITLVNPKLHNVLDFSEVIQYDGREVKFLYSPEFFTSDVNFWIPVKCEIYHEIKWILNFRESPNWLGLHLTISNLKYAR